MILYIYIYIHTQYIVKRTASGPLGHLSKNVTTAIVPLRVTGP